MINLLAAVNAESLLIAMCVVCGVMFAAVATMSVLVAKRRKYDRNVMLEDVYEYKTADKTLDCVNCGENSVEIEPSTYVVCDDMAGSGEGEDMKEKSSLGEEETAGEVTE